MYITDGSSAIKLETKGKYKGKFVPCMMNEMPVGLKALPSEKDWRGIIVSGNAVSEIASILRDPNYQVVAPAVSEVKKITFSKPFDPKEEWEMAIGIPQAHGEPTGIPSIDKSASVRRGETWENNNLRVHRYHDSLKVWDLKHAGKRGKNVEIMHIMINDWRKPNPKRSYLDDLANFLTKSTTYDKYKKLVISFLEKAGFSDVVGNRNSAISFTSEKGVRIAPPDMGKIVINNRFVSAYFELGGFHIQDKTDQYNLPTMMNTDRRSPKKLYKFVAGNKELFERMDYKEMYQFLTDYKIKFRVYMGMD